MNSNANLPGRNKKASQAVSAVACCAALRLWHARLILGTLDATGTLLEREAGPKPAACQHVSNNPAEFGASWRKVVNICMSVAKSVTCFWLCRY